MNIRRDLLWVILGRVAVAALTLVSIRVGTSVLPPTEYGALSVLIAFQMFCGLLLINPLGQHINRHTHAWWDEGSLLARLRDYRAWVLFSAMLGAIASGAWAILFSANTIFASLGMGIAVFSMVISATWNATWIPLLNMLGFRGESAAWAAGTVTLGLLASWFLTRVSPTAEAWFVGQAAGMAIGALGGLVTIRMRHPGASGTGIRYKLVDGDTIRKYCFPLAVATGFMWLQVGGYRLVIEYYWSLSLLGLVAVGLGLASQVWGLCESLAMQFLGPYFYRRINEGDGVGGEQAFSDFVNVLGPVYLLICGVMVAAADVLVTVFVDRQYAAAAIFVVLGAMIECGRVMANLFGNAAHVVRMTTPLIAPWAIGAILSWSLLIGAGALQSELIWGVSALIAGAIALTLVMIWKMQRILPFELDRGRWAWSASISILSAILGGAIDWPDDVFFALGALTLFGFAAGTVAGVLVWRNPAAHRLIAVRLRQG